MTFEGDLILHLLCGAHLICWHGKMKVNPLQPGKPSLEMLVCCLKSFFFTGKNDLAL